MTWQKKEAYVRTGYYLYAQVTEENWDWQWLSTKLNKNDNMFMVNGYLAEGAGESLVLSAADFENFLEPRIVLSDKMESDLEPVITLLVKNRWPFRIHATYGESIDRMLNVFEKVNKQTPFNGLRWFFDHAETITDAELDRVKNLGGGIVSMQDVLPGRIVPKIVWRTYWPNTANPENARKADSRWSWHRCNKGVYFQSMDEFVLGRHRQNNWRLSVLAG